MLSLEKLSAHQKYALFYAFLFYGVVTSGYVPFLNKDGLLLGLFNIHLQDDLLHLFSGTWALWAVLKSKKESMRYFRWFGLYYTADAFVGFFTGYTIIDVFMMNWHSKEGYMLTDLVTNFLINLPHFILGPAALFIGYKVDQSASKKKKK